MHNYVVTFSLGKAFYCLPFISSMSNLVCLDFSMSEGKLNEGEQGYKVVD